MIDVPEQCTQVLNILCYSENLVLFGGVEESPRAEIILFRKTSFRIGLTILYSLSVWNYNVDKPPIRPPVSLT